MARLSTDGRDAARLLGHLLEMCNGAGVGAQIQVSAVPLLQNARELAERGIAPAGTLRNRDTFRRAVDSTVSETDLTLMCDAQTSGGLLVAIAPERATDFEAAGSRRGVDAHRIGSLTARAGVIELRP